MIAAFSFPTTIRFGAGAVRELPDQLVRRGMQRPLLVTDPGLVDAEPFKMVSATLAGQAHIFSGVHPNPTETDVEGAAEAFHKGECDSVIAVGGGSALDVGKAIRLRVKRPNQTLREFDFNADWSGLVPFIAIPTTAGTGSEVGRSSVILIDGVKKVVFQPALLASLVILADQ